MLDNHITIPKRQRGLVLSGGGALGAYEVGVLKAFCKKFEEEKKNRDDEEKEKNVISILHIILYIKPIYEIRAARVSKRSRNHLNAA